jgi:hypothetical protein
MLRKFSIIFGIGLLLALGTATAQEKSTSTRTVHAEIVDVSGNTVIAKTDQGNREYKVPDGFKFQMDGKDIGVADLKPGMKVTATRSSSAGPRATVSGPPPTSRPMTSRFSRTARKSRSWICASATS